MRHEKSQFQPLVNYEQQGGKAMKSFISVVYPNRSPLPSAFYFEHKKYNIDKYVSGTFFDGVSIHEVMISGKKATIFHEEIPHVRRWYVWKKTA